jgi:nucleoid-associated protein YgaU
MKRVEGAFEVFKQMTFGRLPACPPTTPSVLFALGPLKQTGRHRARSEQANHACRRAGGQAGMGLKRKPIFPILAWATAPRPFVRRRSPQGSQVHSV